jgi:hypothetical protein
VCACDVVREARRNEAPEHHTTHRWCCSGVQLVLRVRRSVGI